ncbi:helix-turn-helix transcriptional regulator [Allostreptomyces psammosilenae]|uniref:Transcriptional regulator with XRE-family HTH domain n=1 Tax=Allostreptomyces psammosilenae TaxID=1892865 RepID=A0A853A0L6_9ACTN|nr:helix-turn-helix transcriptional regulator [Allostreptomyces psammosilenae]NYI07000.1 transcriptional regulator with XRE-family HTH domain [Allostreptomyces psammosilenae]
MIRRAELGEFLRSRRARLQPADVGLPEVGGQRRVPGLRREELAMLAGVSVDHYTRLEQGRGVQFSEAVLDAVARALRLSEVERQHLHNLARPSAGAPEPQHEIRPGLRRLLDSLHDVPAFVVGRRTDVLAWNPLAAALIADFGALPPAERNKARLVFLDEGMRERYRDWEHKADDVVAYLRLDAGRHPGDPRLAALVEELCERSPEFRERWAVHQVRDKTHGTYALHHPLVGDVQVGYETLRLPEEPDQALVTYTVEEGSPSQTALRLLASLTAVCHGS